MTPFEMKRRALRFKQKDIALNLRVSKQLVSFWEAGKKKPGPDHVAPLAVLFDMSVEDLVKLIDETERAAKADAAEARDAKPETADAATPAK